MSDNACMHAVSKPLRLLYFTQIFIYFSKPLRLLYSLIIYEIVNFSFFTLYSLLLLSFFLYLKSVPIYVIVHARLELLVPVYHVRCDVNPSLFLYYAVYIVVVTIDIVTVYNIYAWLHHAV